MAALAQNQLESKEVGEILLKVQDELKNLRSLINADGTKVDVKIIQSTLQRTENELKQKADSIINNLNNQVKVLQLNEPHNLSSHGAVAPLETLFDMAKKERRRSATSPILAKRQEPQFMLNASNAIVNKDPHDQVYEQIEELQQQGAERTIPYGLSPGQQVKVYRETKALFDPENPKNRQALSENYNIQLPLIEKRKAYKMQTHLITGSTVEHLSTLPLAYRRNPTLAPPQRISDKDASYGLMSLIERGLIPNTANITFEPIPIAGTKIKSPSKDKNAQLIKRDELVYKLDPNMIKSVMNESKESHLVSTSSFDKLHKSSNESKKRGLPSKKIDAKFTSASEIHETSTNLLTDNPFRPPATPLNNQQMQMYNSNKTVHRFVIQSGRTRTDTSDFVSFKQSYVLRWGSVVSIIKYLEALCQAYSVPIGIVDGGKVNDLSRCIDMDLKPTVEELLDTFLNKEEVEKILRTPGQRFKRRDGHILAAIVIQSYWRRFRDRRAYLAYKKRKWAAGMIALIWLSNVKIAKTRAALKLTRFKQLENFKRRQKEFIREWPRIKNSRRVIIHIPSLGYPESIRNKMSDLPIRENYQISRICDLMDDNVDVIYVSPVPVTEETLQYYSKLFGLRTAIETGDATNQSDVTARYKIVIPEALNSFPNHKMALSTLLKYSPRSLNRIKNLIKGRDAYIVPGVMNHDDIHVADKLNVPVLCCEPDLANLYSTKSGAQRIFQSAKVDTPHGEFDIYNREQLYECLAKVITENLTVQRWLFKLDNEFDGRGIAYCDISKHLSCYSWSLKEMVKFGDKWSKRWAYEPTYVKVLEEIPTLLENFAKPGNTQAYPNWDAFMKAFLAQGGIIEAHPPSDNVTALTVSMLIEPDTNVRIISSGDHIHAESTYSCWGYSFPQTSVEPELLNESCMRIAKSCQERNIYGYVDVDFVTFIDPKTDKQVLWATDLDISYSENVAMTSLLLYLTNGRFDSNEHSYEVDLIKPDPNNKKAKRTQENKSRFATMSMKLNHSNLAIIHYSVFFQTCRAVGIGFDIKEKQGSIFTLVDSLNHANMGMLTVSDSLQSAMSQFTNNLMAIHNQISTENMQGRTNFILASNDIRNALALTADEEED